MVVRLWFNWCTQIYMNLLWKLNYVVALDHLVRRYFPKELYDTLVALGRGEGEVMEVSRVAGVSHTFILHVLPFLEDLGFVTVTHGKRDKRKKYLRLTDGGEFLMEVLELYRTTLKGDFDMAKGMMKRVVKI